MQDKLVNAMIINTQTLRLYNIYAACHSHWSPPVVSYSCLYGWQVSLCCSPHQVPRKAGGTSHKYFSGTVQTFSFALLTQGCCTDSAGFRVERKFSCHPAQCQFQYRSSSRNKRVFTESSGARSS